jgi:microcystin-dependent protein
MATNEILTFASTDTGTNLLTQAEYTSDSQRTIGNQPGIARSKLVNKALRQSTLVSAALAQYIANKQGVNVTDGKTVSELEAMLIDAIAAQITGSLPEGVPAGSVIYVAKSLPPSGYIKANGAVVSRTTYANLFAAIGTTFGAGDGSTTFGLPDLRGEFMRGLDDGRGVDPSRGLGTSQGDAIRNLTGFFNMANDGGSHYNQSKDWQGVFKAPATTTLFDSTTNNRYTTGPFGVQFDASLQVPTSSENRPRNVAMLACIKF